MAEAHDQRGRDHAEEPAEEYQVPKKWQQAEAKTGEVKLVGKRRDDGEDDQGEGDPQDPYHASRRDVFSGADRCDEDVEQITRPNVLKEGNGHPLLRPEKHVPQDHAADQEGELHADQRQRRFSRSC